VAAKHWLAATTIAASFLLPNVQGASLDAVTRRMDSDLAAGKPLVAHVVVALVDNQYQGIVPVPAALGNGSDPKSNLYWGAMYGVRSFLRRSADWHLMPVASHADARVLDRATFMRKFTRNGVQGEMFLVAEAWQGEHIAAAIRRFLELNRGEHREALRIGDRVIDAGGAAHVIVFVGHNGLMDSAAPVLPPTRAQAMPHASVVLACFSDDYFSSLLGPDSAPLLMTTGLMAPEAYTIDAALKAWFDGAPPAAVRVAAAGAYARYQRISERSALRLFVSPSVEKAP
jgi:hypothetical protein